MRLIGTGTLKNKISGTGILKKKIIGTGRLKSLAPTGETCPEYDLIDGGTPSTTYAPINGFNLISGGTP